MSNGRQRLCLRVCVCVQFSLWLNSVLTRDSGSFCCFPAVSSQYGWRETNYIITPHSGGWHLCGSLLQTGWEARVKINPLFNPKSLKNKLWALLLPVNGSGSEQNPVWPALPSALFFKAPRCPAAVCRRAALLPLRAGPPDTTLCRALRYVHVSVKLHIRCDSGCLVLQMLQLCLRLSSPKLTASAQQLSVSE